MDKHTKLENLILNLSKCYDLTTADGLMGYSFKAVEVFKFIDENPYKEKIYECTTLEQINKFLVHSNMDYIGYI